MLSDVFKNNNKLMLSFFLAPLKILWWSGFFSMVIFVAMSIYAIRGDWTIGTNFDTWYTNVTGVEPVNGMFSADNFKGCWCCAVFAKVFDLLSVVSLNIYVFISDIVWTLITMGIAVWILIKVYNYIKEEQSENFADILKELTKKLFIIAIIGVAINYAKPERLKSMANLIFENTAVPILQMGVGVGTEIIKSPICDKLTYQESEVDGLLSPQVKNEMLCLVNSINVVFLSGTTAGANMVSFSLKEFLHDKNPAVLLDIIGGMAMIVIFFMMYIFIPFTLIDFVFTIGILIAFVPIMFGGYAYNETKGFSNTGFKSLFGMAFYIIMYCLFLGIIYSSFIFIGDMYYPGPLDNFTYLFPDFIYNNMVAGQTEDIMKSNAFANCFNSANGNVSKMQTCLLSKNIQFEMPSLQNPGGSFLPMFSLGLISLMIMSNLKTYAGLVSGYVFNIGQTVLSLIKSSMKWATSAVRTEVGQFTNPLNKIASLKSLQNDASKLEREIKESEE